MNKNILKARDFAILKHGDQKYGDKPYIYHLDMVYNIIKELNLGEDYEIAAYLHDIIEDTPTKKEELIFNFNEFVYNLVDSVSGIGKNRKERKLSMIDKLTKFNAGINLKMVDRYANMKEAKENNEKLFNMYKIELSDYNDLFSIGDNRIMMKIKDLVKNEIKIKFK